MLQGSVRLPDTGRALGLPAGAGLAGASQPGERQQLLLSPAWRSRSLTQTQTDTGTGAFLPVPGVSSMRDGSGWVQNPFLPSRLTGLHRHTAGPLLSYPASNLSSFTVTAFREQWYSVQLRLIRSSLKLLKPNSPQKPTASWMFVSCF